jgi:hypothetical protein
MRRSPGRGQRERSTKAGANHRTRTPTTDPDDGSVPGPIHGEAGGLDPKRLCIDVLAQLGTPPQSAENEAGHHGR